MPLAWAGIMLFRRIQFPSELVIAPRFELDQRALLFSLAVAMGSVVLFGLIPAIQMTRTNLAAAFKSGGGVVVGKPRLWGRNLLVAVQVAVSLVLLTVAVFASNMFRGELAGGLGFRTDHIALLTVDPRLLRYSDAQAKRFFETLAERAEALPGVNSVALTSAMLGQNIENAGVQPEGFQFPAGQDFATIFSSRVSEHYFETIGIPIVRGRGFAKTDTAEAPLVTVVNETLAAHYWPNQNPVGKRLRLNGARWVEIVGIARNSRYAYTGEPPTEFLYLPYQQSRQGNLTLLAASAGDSASLLVPLRALVLDLDPNMPVYDAQTMEHFYAAKVTGVRTGDYRDYWGEWV